MTRLLGRIAWGLVALVWWLPSILLALAAIVGDRIRCRAVLAWARVLRLLGRRDAALRVYESVLRRTKRRRQKLAERDAR